jgi:hypothetical protein
MDVSRFSQRLHMMDYCNDVEGFFINYTLSNMRNINGDDIKCSCKRYKNKKFIGPDVVIIHLLHKGFMEKYLYLYLLKDSNKSLWDECINHSKLSVVA